MTDGGGDIFTIYSSRLSHFGRHSSARVDVWVHYIISPPLTTYSLEKNVLRMAKQNIDFKDPLYMAAWLDGALKKEKEKYEKCPVTPDMVPGYADAQAWGYIVTGYSLAEQSFKALLHLRDKEVQHGHSLSTLFNSFDDNDKEILSEYYIDYRATIGGNRGEFRFKSLDDYLVNLDSDTGSNQGSLAWRYYLIEEVPKMPFVSVDYLHEVVFGCIKIVKHAKNGHFEPLQYTHSWRMRCERQRKYNDWLTVRMGDAGWNDLGDRLEILWGPDYRGRHDLLLFKGIEVNDCFAEIPDDPGVPTIDKKKEIDALDVEEGYRSIGVTFA